MTTSRPDRRPIALAFILLVSALPATAIAQAPAPGTPDPVGDPEGAAPDEPCLALVDEAARSTGLSPPPLDDLRSLCAARPDGIDLWLDDLVEHLVFLQNPIPNPGAEAPLDPFRPSAPAAWGVEGGRTADRADGRGRVYVADDALTFHLPPGVRGGDSLYLHLLDGSARVEVRWQDGPVAEAELTAPGERVVDLARQVGDAAAGRRLVSVTVTPTDGSVRLDDLRLDGVCYGATVCAEIDDREVAFDGIHPRAGHDGFAVLIVPYDHSLAPFAEDWGRLEVWVGIVRMSPSGPRLPTMAEARSDVLTTWLATETPGADRPTYHRPYPDPVPLGTGRVGAEYARVWADRSEAMTDADAAPGWVFSLPLRQVLRAETMLAGWVLEPTDSGPGGSPRRYHGDFAGKPEVLGYYNEEKLQAPGTTAADQLDLAPSPPAVGAWLPGTAADATVGEQPGAPAGDPDGDDVPNRADNCSGTHNPGQTDTDGDGQGDRCDADDDGDDVQDPEDDCPRDASGSVDSDGDGRCDGADNCPDHPNADQTDTDGDGQGDACDPDDDGDGLDDDAEAEAGTKTTDPDTDGDGVQDGPEVHAYGSDPLAVHSDDDGLDDGAEVHDHGTHPVLPDTDGDGLDDGRETKDTDDPQGCDDADGATGSVRHAAVGDDCDGGWGTDPAHNDTDADGLLDGAEVHDHGTDPLGPDTDGDGLEDGAEVHDHGTDPTAVDSDGDGLDDGREVDVLRTAPVRTDTDGDGLSDGQEAKDTDDPQGCDEASDPVEDARHRARGDDCDGGYGTDPAWNDTDADRLLDGAEVERFDTDPTHDDTDADGLLDGAEVHDHGTDPTFDDTDGDALPDGAEVHDHGTDPTDRDTDDDGYDDGTELDAGSDPVWSASTPPDRDGDGVENGPDNCADAHNPDQADMDGDGIGDACDPDRDGDDVDNAPDNCADTHNPDQADRDDDGVGDACDGDTDGDGVPDGPDNCPATANADQADLDRDGTGDACDGRVDIATIAVETGDRTQTAGSTETIPYRARATNADGATFDLAPDRVAWSLDDAAGGTFQGHVLHPSDDAGRYTVEATLRADPSLGATARLDIRPGPLVEAEAVCPDPVVAGQAATCRLAGEDAYGNAASDVDAEWSARDANGDPYPIGDDGTVTAPTRVADGPLHVTASADGRTGEATVAIVAGELARVNVEDAPGGDGSSVQGTSLANGETVTLHAIGRDRYGNLVGELTVAWSTEGDDVLELSTDRGSRVTVTASGHGPARVVARSSSGLTGRTGVVRVLDASAPSAVDDLSSTTHAPGTWSTSRRIHLTWGPATDDVGVAGYRVGVGEVLGDRVAGTEVRLDLPRDGSQRVTVRAVDAAGHVGPGARFGPVRVDTVPPGPPGDVRAEKLPNGSVALTWDAADDATSGVAVYRILAGDRTIREVAGTRAVVDDRGPLGVAAVDAARLVGPTIRAGEPEVAVRAGPEEVGRISDLLGVPLPDGLTARDGDGDGRVDAVPDGPVRVVQAFDVAGRPGLLLAGPGEGRALWDVGDRVVHAVRPVDGTLDGVRREEGTVRATVAVENKTGWIVVAAPDAAPDRPIASVETGDGRTIPRDRVWRTADGVRILDDPTVTYTIVYGPAGSSPSDRPAGGLAERVPTWLTGALAVGALVAAALVAWRVRRREGSA